jgi:hypothetical protein
MSLFLGEIEDLGDLGHQVCILLTQGRFIDDLWDIFDSALPDEAIDEIESVVKEWERERNE